MNRRMFSMKVKAIAVSATLVALLGAALLFGASVNAAEEEGFAKAVCVINGTGDNEVHGTITFTQTKDGVMIEAHVMGLSPGKHGFHIHEFGDLSSGDGKSAGGHFNPDGSPHASPSSAKRHAGDLGNIESNADGHAMYSRLDKVIEIHGPNAILSRAIVIHGGADDMESQPSGAAGPRVAVGVIGLGNSE